MVNAFLNLPLVGLLLELLDISFSCLSVRAVHGCLPMADTEAPPSLSLPPPPQTFAGAPGQPGYESATSNGHNNPAHMPPPPLPPVVIPQNNNPVPTAITTPGASDSGIMSPGSGSSGGYVRRAAPEPNKRALYVGGLDPRVDEGVLKQIFETTGHVQNVKIIPDKGNMGVINSGLPSNVSIPRFTHLLSCFPLHCDAVHSCITTKLSGLNRALTRIPAAGNSKELEP